MNREKLIRQIKDEYARLADMESKSSFVDAVGDVRAEPYYEALLSQVLDGVAAGRFDGFDSGRAVVEAVANDREKWGITLK